MRPQVVAHRGASHDNAEHTLGAYLHALDEGADALECDVRLTADGHLVCVHDRDLRRTASHHGLVSTMQLAELDQLDFAAWKNPWADLDDEAPEEDAELGRVVTLAQAVRDGGRLRPAGGDRRRDQAPDAVRRPRRAPAGHVLQEFGWHRADSPVRVMSFSYTALHRMQKLTPDLRLVLLLDRKRSWPMLRNVVVAETGRLGPGIDLLQEHRKLRTGAGPDRATTCTCGR